MPIYSFFELSLELSSAFLRIYFDERMVGDVVRWVLTEAGQSPRRGRRE